LVDRAHRILTAKLDQLEEDGGKALRKVPISQLAKLYDTLLKYHGIDAKAKAATRVLGLAERVERMERLAKDWRASGVIPGAAVDASLPAAVLEAGSSKEDAGAQADSEFACVGAEARRDVAGEAVDG